MRKYEFKSNIRQESFQMKDFLGVDFTTHESEVASKRSPDSVNMISGLQGSVDKRFGTEITKKFEGKIWAIKHIKTYVYGTEIIDGLKERFEIDVTIVHEGTRLWAYNPHLDTWQQCITYYNGGSSTTVLKERETQFVEYPNNSYFTLIHNNWINSKDDLLILFCTGSTYSGEEGKIWFQIELNDVFSTNVYIPTTSIGRSPDGKISTPYEGSNLMVNARINRFLSDATSTIFKLDFNGDIYEYGSYPLFVFQMKSDGKWGTPHDASGNPITWTFNTANRTVTFSAVPHATYITGQDNIEVYFRTSQSTKRITSQINYYSSHAYFGFSGRNDFIFFCNHIESRFRNKEIWMSFKSDEYNQLKLYLDENNYSMLGSNRKIGYSKVGQYLVLHGKSEDKSSVAYLKEFGLDADGEAFVTSKPTTSQVGAISPHAFANLRDDPLFVSESGISAVLIDNVTNIQSIQDRGFYINQKLLQEPNLDKALGFIFDNKYFVCVNNHVYIADSRMKSTERRSYSESYQYDWYYWEGLDVQSYSINNNELYFGTTDGRLMKYKKESSEYAYHDEVIATETTWQTLTEYALGAIVKDDGVTPKYYVCIKPHTSDGITLSNEFYWNEIVKGTDRFYVPVLAYWTTPIMNMDNITVKKTLKNLWVRLPKYKDTGVRIYYSTQGLIKEQFDGIFDFGDIDFSRFTFSTDTDPMVVVTNRQERKFMSIQFKIESRDGTPMSLLEIVGKYTVNSAYKG